MEGECHRVQNLAKNKSDIPYRLKSTTMRKISLLIIVLGLAKVLMAQDSTTTTFKFNHLAISVKDVNRSAEFYKTVLKLEEITNLGKFEGVRWLSMGDGKELHLVSIVKENVVTNKALHIAFTTPNFDVFIKRLDTLKITYSDWPGTANKVNIRADGTKQVFFQDPDGYWIEVNSLLK